MLYLLMTGMVVSAGIQPSTSSILGEGMGDSQSKLSQIALVADDASPAASSQRPSVDHAEQTVGIQDIVVTAQRRTERSQDVPISISAISATGLEQRGLANAQELGAVVPGLQFGSSGTNGTPFIRGIGGVLTNPSDEPSVATYIDGVYIASPNANYATFNNIERVEVLKGPQGTLFGRNATGGVIQVITKDPSRTPVFEASAGFANYDTATGAIYGSAPISDDLAFNVAAQIEDQGRGWGRDIASGRATYKRDEYSVRSKLLYTPGDATRITLAADYNKYKTSGLNYQRPRGVPYLDGAFDLRPFDTRSGTDEVVSTEAYGGSLRVEHDFTSFQVNSITAYRRAKGLNFFDFDLTPLNIIAAKLHLRQRNFSQELHVTSPQGSAVTWLVGGYYYNGRGGNAPGRVLGGAVAPLEYADTFGEMRTRSFSLFGQAMVEVLPQTNLTGGFRYTWEKQRLAQSLSSNIGVLVPNADQRQSFNKPTWRISVDHNFTPDVLAYASFNRGIKSGGWDILAAPGTVGFRPEVLDAAEVGLKSSLADRRVRLNTSAFWYEYQDLQVQNQVAAASITTNAAKARIRGVDVELEVAPTAGLNISLTGAYIVGKYRKYENAIAFTPTGTASMIDASGNRTIRTPKFTGSATASYRFDTAVGGFTATATYIYSSRFFWLADMRLDQPSYGRLNGSLMWDINDQFYLRAWGKNLTDKRYLESGVESALGDVIRYAAPRTYGLTVGVRVQ